MPLPDAAYARLLALRTALRRFEHWSARQAEAAGLTPTQHQLLLAVRGHGDHRGPTIREAADYLLLRHHSAVGLVDRAEAAGLVRRVRDDDDRRVVRLELTPEGGSRLEALSALHLEELDRLALALDLRSESSRDVVIARVYDTPPARPGTHRVLVDRLWPRGVRKEGAPIDEWQKDVAPSAELRIWFGHAPDRYEEFARRYRSELSRSPASGALEQLAHQSEAGSLVLVTATRDVAHSAASVLRELLTAG